MQTFTENFIRFENQYLSLLDSKLRRHSFMVLRVSQIVKNIMNKDDISAPTT
jgi:hypothetical protein